MGKATEQLKTMIVSNPKIELEPGDVCFYMAKAQLGKPYDKTTVTTKSGPGIGVTVPLTQHFGLGLFRRKVKTEVKTQTAWQKTPCTLYVLSEKFAFSVGKEVYYIDNEDVKELKLHKDALVIGSRNYTFYMLMANKDVRRFEQIFSLIQQAQKEGARMEDFGYVASRSVSSASNSSVVVNNRADAKTAQSDYAKTVFVWAFSRKACPVKKREEYPSYCFYELGIQNAKTYHEQLIKEGYFEEAKPQELLETFKVDKLKEILTAHGLEAKGKKEALITKIVEGVPAAQLALLLSEKMFSISSFGQNYLDAHDDYVKIHQHSNWNINYQEYDAARAKNPSLPFFDICWGIFNARIMANKGNIGLDRNEYYNMFQLLECENRKDRAMELLLQVFYIDVNDSKMFAPAIVKGIGDYEEYYNPAYIDKLYSLKLPRMSCSKEVFASIVESIIRGNFDETIYLNKLR